MHPFRLPAHRAVTAHANGARAAHAATGSVMSMLNLAAHRNYQGASLRFHRGLVASLAGASVLLVATAGAQTPLTLADAQRRAIERSRQLVAQDSAVTAAREMGVAAA